MNFIEYIKIVVYSLNIGVDILNTAYLAFGLSFFGFFVTKLITHYFEKFYMKRLL